MKEGVVNTQKIKWPSGGRVFPGVQKGVVASKTFGFTEICVSGC